MSLRSDLTAATANITFISETDSPVEVFTTRREFEEIEWDNFFRRLISQNADWKPVRELMETALDDLRVLKITNESKVVYEVSGAEPDKERVGFRLKATDT